MKLPNFEYERPATIEAAIGILQRNAGNARPLAGGQSLMPLLAFRLASPTVLVDLAGIPGLDRIRVDQAGLHLGALVRWRQLEDSAEVARANPLIAAAVPHISHYQIRNRGTVGGSLAHGDPAAELPCLAVTCEATIEIAGPKGARTLPARDLYLGPMVTSLQPDEIITGVTFPAWSGTSRWAFEEFATHRGAFALAGIAAHMDIAGGTARNVRLGAFGAASVPMRLTAAEAVIEGKALDAKAITAAAQKAATEVDPSDDIHAGADYRRALVATLLERALSRIAG